jgi:predicted nucleic acid-binding protein
MKAVFDTNILIDYLNGINKAQKELEKYQHPIISVITWMEILIGAKNNNEELSLRGFLSSFSMIDLTEAVAERAVKLRRKHRLKLPDAIIWATAEQQECTLVTRNTRDFDRSMPNIRIPYAV